MSLSMKIEEIINEIEKMAKKYAFKILKTEHVVIVIGFIMSTFATKLDSKVRCSELSYILMRYISRNYYCTFCN